MTKNKFFKILGIVIALGWFVLFIVHEVTKASGELNIILPKTAALVVLVLLTVSQAQNILNAIVDDAGNRPF